MNHPKKFFSLLFSLLIITSVNAMSDITSLQSVEEQEAKITLYDCEIQTTAENQYLSKRSKKNKGLFKKKKNTQKCPIVQKSKRKRKFKRSNKGVYNCYNPTKSNRRIF